jgi:hypothetical protein
MRVTLSSADSTRYLTGDPEAWRIEEAILSWAQGEAIVEPVVVTLASGENVFAFCLDGEGKP